MARKKTPEDGPTTAPSVIEVMANTVEPNAIGRNELRTTVRPENTARGNNKEDLLRRPPIVNGF